MSLSRTSTNTNTSTSTSTSSINTPHNLHKSSSSPIASPPSLSQSASSSASSSVPKPTTPPRGRLSSRYPNTLGRVPLHRRGTSRTYEHLEDLLREAGYKETRIFTPEGERAEAEAAERSADEENGGKASRKRTSVRGSVGAVVDFLAGLMPSVAGSNPNPQPESANNNADQLSEAVPQLREERARSPTSSPLAHRKRATRSTDLHSSTGASSSESLHTSQSSSGPPTSSASTARPRKHISQHQRITPSRQLPHQPSSTSLLRASYAYLPYMAPKPHNPLAPHTSARDGQDDKDHKPPLSETMLQSVTRGFLLRGPSSTSLRVATLARPPLRQTRSSISQPGWSGGKGGCKVLSDYTNTDGIARGAKRASPLQLATALLAPPPLCARMLTERAGMSEGKVSLTAVVCRSAPVSRSGSRVRMAVWGNSGGKSKRGELGDPREKQRRNAKEKERKREKNKKKSKDQVPSLASTRVEGDVWGGDGANRFSSEWGVSGESDEEDCPPSSSESELDLARLLVPPKRQNSIRSLRRHLQVRTDVGGSLGRLGTRGLLLSSGSGTTTPGWTDREDGGEDGWGNGWRRKRGRRFLEEEERYRTVAGLFGAGECSAGNGVSAMGKRRRGIPGAWAG